MPTPIAARRFDTKWRIVRPMLAESSRLRSCHADSGAVMTHLPSRRSGDRAPQ